MLEMLDMKQKLSKTAYRSERQALQQRLLELAQAAYRARVPVMVVLEGWASAGKGDAIRVLAGRLDPRGFRVVPIKPPRTAERRYPWMWRFWQQVPAYGQIVVFDSSWYRRVLIERVLGQVRKREWQRAYQDILAFEQQLAADGALIVKFWLHISRKEQARRFKKLRADKLTAWQVSDEDAAEHQAYKRFRAAAEEMLARTEAPHAPWTLVEANDRRFAVIKVLRTMCAALEAQLETAGLATQDARPSVAPVNGAAAASTEAEASHA
jgi:AMP-polyphosphate phosphotransferase